MILKQAVILAGGLGSRLGHLTKSTPKPLLKINKIPFIEYLIKYFFNYGIEEIILLTSYKNFLFKKKYDKKNFEFLKIKCIKEKKLLGTAGALFSAKKHLKENFLLCNGDTIFDINLFDLVKKFKKKYVGILACSTIQENNNRYTIFNSKKKLVSSGVYIFNKKKIFRYLGKNKSLEKNVLKKLPKSQFKKIPFKKKFLDIGTPSDFAKAEKFLLNIQKRKCAFLDRDGVINYDLGYVHKKKDFKFKNKVIEAIKFLNSKNYFVIVISNQSGVGRGYYTEENVNNLHTWINKKLWQNGAFINKFYYSPYYQFAKKAIYRKGKNDRKPNIGLFTRAFSEFNIQKKGSFFVGDKKIDKESAKRLKLKYFGVNNKTNLYEFLKKKLI